MQVFKAYFKIIKRNFPSMLIYMGVFLFFAVVLANSGGGVKAATDFSPTKTKIAFINNDEPSPLVNGLKSYLGQNATIVDLGKDQQSLQDALFFREVEYVVNVPAGFTQQFLEGEHQAELEKTTVPGSIDSVSMDYRINQYLNTANLYLQTTPDLPGEELIAYLNHDLAQEASVQINTYGNTTVNSNVTNYFIYLAYSLMAIMILGITSTMIVFNQTDLKRRNLCTPLPSGMFNMQLILGSLTFAVAIWASISVLAVPFYGIATVNQNFVLLSLNALVFTGVCLSISFLVGNLIKSRNVQSALANVLSLGMCFLSGVFVPQEMLGDTVKSIAAFTPTYWYVKAINGIKDINLINAESITPIIYSMLIQLGFAAAFLAVALAIAKQKRTSNA